MKTVQEKLHFWIDGLVLRGFDTSSIVSSATWRGQLEYIRVSCSQCEALVINGVAYHETGCPNEKHECNGCNELVSRGRKYCEDCI